MEHIPPNTDDRGAAPDLPDLTSALTNIYTPPGPLPDSVRDQLLHQARTEMSNLRRSRRWGAIAVSAAAAMIVFTFQIVLRDAANPDATTPPIVRIDPPALRKDIDGNGRIDILDAFALARHIERRGAAGGDWDFNHDGRVDQLDIDAVALSAVRLKGDAS